MEVCYQLLNQIFNPVVTYLGDSHRRKRIDDALVRMMASDMQPASIVEDRGFHGFLKVIDPKYIPPSRRTIMRDLLPKFYNGQKAILKTSLANSFFCTVTTDLWTSRSTQGFQTVTCHYIKDSEHKSSVLQTIHFDTSHTGVNIARELKKVTDEWEITDKVVCAVTDSASNMN